MCASGLPSIQYEVMWHPTQVTRDGEPGGTMKRRLEDEIIWKYAVTDEWRHTQISTKFDTWWWSGTGVTVQQTQTAVGSFVWKPCCSGYLTTELTNTFYLRGNANHKSKVYWLANCKQYRPVTERLVCWGDTKEPFNLAHLTICRFVSFVGGHPAVPWKGWASAAVGLNENSHSDNIHTGCSFLNTELQTDANNLSKWNNPARSAD